MELRNHHTANKTSEGIELIEPRAPEFRDLRFWDCDAAEKGECYDDEGVEEGGDER